MRTGTTVVQRDENGNFFVMCILLNIHNKYILMYYFVQSDISNTT